MNSGRHTNAAMGDPDHASPSAGRRCLDPARVTVRVEIAGLWAAVLFVFAYVDIFSLYRPDVRADLEAGTLGGFTIGQPFLLSTTLYVAVPSIMLYAVLVLPARVARVASVVLAAVYALTIAVGAVGEWNYYVLGSAIEIAFLAVIVRRCWTWPRLDPETTSRPHATGHDRDSKPDGEGDQPWSA